MAQHIASIAGAAGIPTTGKQDFYSQLNFGDLVFCQGNYAISRGIELVTGSPFSHVLSIWLPPGANEWLTMEATSDRGVHVGKLSDYVDKYDGNLILARRQSTTLIDRIAGMNAFFSVLEDSYDFIQEGTIVAHKLVARLPVLQPSKEYYCSGLQYFMSCATLKPLQKPGPNLPTPEDNWTDPSVAAVCSLIKS